MPERQKVMVVEDHPELRAAIVELFTRNAIDPIGVGDGKSALRTMFERRPDCVVLDVGLPDIDGWTVLDRIREISDVPIMMLTARHLEEEKVRALDAGADDYLTKPYGSAELVARVNALLRRTRPTDAVRSDFITVGPLSIDPSTARVEVQGVQISLTKTEFRLLHLLATERTRVLSSSQLLDRVWDDPSGIGTDRVKYMVARLRQKLEVVAGASDMIESVRGFGYRLQPIDLPVA